MYKIFVLFDGFVKISENGKEMYANCTCTLIKGPKNIIVDTMTAWDSTKILNSLKFHQLTPEDIDYVVCTHGHSDHMGNNNLFLNSIHIVGQSISKGETYFLHNFEEDYVIDDKIKIIATPGHTLSCVSLILKTDEGLYAIVGDLFENEDDLEDEKIWIEAGSEDKEQQKKNREKILRIADFIVPGHGSMFKVNK